MTENWWGLDLDDYWLCPNCNIANLGSNWLACEPACDDCGNHDGKECPGCEEQFDHVYGVDKVIENTYQEEE